MKHCAFLIAKDWYGRKILNCAIKEAATWEISSSSFSTLIYVYITHGSQLKRLFLCKRKVWTDLFRLLPSWSLASQELDSSYPTSDISSVDTIICSAHPDSLSASWENTALLLCCLMPLVCWRMRWAASWEHSIKWLQEGLKDLNGKLWLKTHPEQKEVVDLPGQRNSLWATHRASISSSADKDIKQS